MADSLVNVRIVFKEPHREESYQMAEAERNKLTQAFCASDGQAPLRYGAYVAQFGGEPRMLAVRFGDILFIG